jgi:undecaprenyl-diphosphatase
MLDRLRSLLARTGLLEAAALISLLIIAGSAWIFAEIADEVLEGESQSFDEMVLQSMRQPGHPDLPLGPAWLTSVARDFTALGSTAIITLVCIGTVGYLAFRKKRGALLLVLVSIAGGALISTGLKETFERPRPSVVAHLTEVSSLSFPSGHSMLAAVTYLTLGSLLARTTSDRRLKVYIIGMAVLLTVIIGLTRMYLGVHYPTDVLGGWCAGISWALLCSLVARYLQRRGAVEAEAPSTPNSRVVETT